MLGIAAAIESRSEHPLADAIVSNAQQANLPRRAVQFFEAFPGKGARAVVEGEVFYIGSSRFMQELGIDVPATTALAVLQLRGCSVWYLSDGE